VTAEYFDGWYADMAASPARDALFARHLGLPPEFQSTSLLGMQGIEEIRDLLALTAGQALLDLACGRAGYGLWLSRQTGCRVVGIDFSAVALEQAREVARTLGQSSDVELQVGSLDATGLPDDCVDAVICIDAIQFAADIVAVGREICRVLRPGGRVAITCWEATDRDDEAVSARLRKVDLNSQLTEAGLVDVRVEARPDWLETERAIWRDATAIEPKGDPALQSIKDEGDRILPTIDKTRRVLATASKAT
jgi:SAM-dependent methyltransferase